MAEGMQRPEVQGLVQRCVSFVISLIILGVIQAIVVNLPAMEITLVANSPITVGAIAGAAVSIIIITLILRFGQEIAPRLASLLPTFPEVATLITNISLFIAILVAYVTFDTPVMFFLEEVDLAWLYPVAFLLFAILPVYWIANTLLASSGEITNLLMGKSKATAIGPTITCPSCGSQVIQSKFCSRCGSALPAEETATSNTCPNCKAELKPGAKFCIKCGTKIVRGD